MKTLPNSFSNSLVISTKSLNELDEKMSKTTFENFLNIDIDQYNNLQFTQEEINSISIHLAKMKTGCTAMVPLFCAGEKCPIKEGCIFWKMGKMPVGKQCLVELSLLNNYILQYMDEYGVDPNSVTERGFCQELATIDIYLYRLNFQLAKPQNALMVVDQVVGVDKEGETIWRSEISPLADYRDRLLNRRARVVRLMVGDPQEKYKRQVALKQKQDNDQSNNQAETSKKIKDLQRQLDQLYGNTGPVGSKTGSGALCPQDIIDSDDPTEI